MHSFFSETRCTLKSEQAEFNVGRKLTDGNQGATSEDSLSSLKRLFGELNKNYNRLIKLTFSDIAQQSAKKTFRENVSCVDQLNDETNSTSSSATAEIPRDADDMKRPFKVTQDHSLLCQWTRHI